MTSVNEYRECPQCGGQADFDLDCGTNEKTLDCYKCGYSAASVQDNQGGDKWKYEEHVGAGAGCTRSMELWLAAPYIPRKS